MSDHHHHNNNGGFLNGFFIGALIGAGAVFFLGTKKGKELAKEISDKGIGVLSDFEDIFEEIEEDAGGQPPSSLPQPSALQPTYSQSSTPTHSTSPQTHHNGNGSANNTHSYSTASPTSVDASTPSHIETLQAQGRRLFSGIPKRR